MTEAKRDERVSDKRLGELLVQCDIFNHYETRSIIKELKVRRAQIDRLANFIMAEMDGEPSQNEGAVDCAIRLLRAQNAQGVEELVQRVLDIHYYDNVHLKRKKVTLRSIEGIEGELRKILRAQNAQGVEDET